MRSFYITLFLVTVLALVGCDSNDFGRHQSEVVVEAYLIANENLEQIRLSRSASADRVFDFTENAIEGANVVVQLLDDAGVVEETYEFFSDSEEPGIYMPVRDMLVQPQRTYRFEADVPGQSENVVATTIVPGAIDLIGVSDSVIVYQSADQLELTLTRSFTPGRQSVFIFATESLEPSVERITPFYRDLIGDSEEDLEDLRITESPIINEGNYDINLDGTITIRLPWLAVAFYGRNRLTANALDDNLFDFLRSQLVQQGGTTLAPGEIPNVIDRVEGGIGVFGSLARSRFEVNILEPTE